MRIVLAHNRYREPGGEERHVALLEDTLTGQGHEVRRFEVDSALLDSSHVSRVRTALGLAYRPAARRQVAAVLREWSPDVVHFHNLFPILTPASLRAAKEAGASVVWTIHNYRFACVAGTLLGPDGRRHDDCLDGETMRCALRNPRGSWSESVAYGIAITIQRRLRLLERWVDAYIAPSSFVAAAMVRAGLPRGRIHVIPHGVPLDDPVTPPGTDVLFAGRLSREKGVATLLDAVLRLPTAHLVVAGDGPLRALVEAAEGPRLTYLGKIAGEELRKVRAGAACVVVPSECHEVLPFSALEAAATARAVVATNLGGLPEIVEDGVTGLLVPPESPDELATAISELIAQPERAFVLGKNARQRAEKRFDLATQTAAVAGLYEALRAKA